MKYTITIFLISIISLSFTPANAAGLQPSLNAQMQRQEKINKKNDLSAKRAEQARLKQEAKDRIAAIQYARLAKKNASIIIPVISPVQPTPTTPLVIKRPPDIVPIKVPQSINTSIPVPPNVDIQRVRAAWLDLYNGVRRSEGLAPYSYDTRIDATAYDWNVEFAKGK
jgi:uncharacterized protein YkwD